MTNLRHTHTHPSNVFGTEGPGPASPNRYSGFPAPRGRSLSSIRRHQPPAPPQGVSAALQRIRREPSAPGSLRGSSHSTSKPLGFSLRRRHPARPVSQEAWRREGAGCNSIPGNSRGLLGREEGAGGCGMPAWLRQGRLRGLSVAREDAGRGLLFLTPPGGDLPALCVCPEAMSASRAQAEFRSTRHRRLLRGGPRRGSGRAEPPTFSGGQASRQTKSRAAPSQPAASAPN